MAEISMQGLTKVYANGVVAVRDVHLDVADGEFLVLVGPSGCGKSTLLRMLAGLEEVSAGRLRIGAKDVTDAAPRARDIAMVFQSYALYPHMTVAKNIGYPLKLAGLPAAEIDARVRAAAATLQLDAVLDRKPSQLSGGQRQRVAMGRAIVRKPSAFLMDEPLSNLDAKLRVQMRAEIAHLQREFATTTVYVTHDQVEAMTMGDRVAVLNQGRIEQCDSPRRLYDSPTNLFVAGFIGSPAMNTFPATLYERDGALGVGTADVTLPVGGPAWRDDLADWSGRDVIVGLRPEAVSDGPIGPNTCKVDARVDFVEELGAEVVVHTIVTATRWTLVTKLGVNAAPRTGDHISLFIDPGQLHLFDPNGPSLRRSVTT